MEDRTSGTQVFLLKCGESMPAPGSTKRRIYGPAKLTMHYEPNCAHGVLEDYPEGACSDPACENPDCVQVREKGALRKALRKTQATIRKTEAAKTRKANTARKRNLRKARKAKASTKLHVMNVPGIGPVGVSLPTDEGAR